MAVNKINETDSLNDGRLKLNESIEQSNQAIEKANEADEKSTNAVNTSNAAETKADSTQAQLDTIVIESGTSDAETLQARTDANANTFNTLRDRLNNSDSILADMVQFSTVTVNIPSDFLTLQDAIDKLSEKKVKQGIMIRLNIESGHRPTSGISVANGDFGHFVITSTDEVVTTNSSFTGRFIECHHGIAPVLDCFIDGVNSLERIYSLFNSIGWVEVGKGGRNTTGRPLYSNASIVNATQTVWENCGDQIYASAGSSIQFGGSTVSGFTHTSNGALVASRGSAIEAQGLIMRNCHIGIECKRAGSRINCHEATFETMNNIAILVWRGAIVSCASSSFTDIKKDCFSVEAGQLAAEYSAISAGSGNTGTGAKVVGGFANVDGATITGFGVDGIECRDAGNIKARGTKVSSSGRHGVFADTGGNICIVGGESLGNVSNDLRVTRGSYISANTCKTKNGTTNPAMGDTNIVTSLNTIDGNKGIIWA
jgi:hypothetical protein